MLPATRHGVRVRLLVAGCVACVPSSFSSWGGHGLCSLLECSVVCRVRWLACSGWQAGFQATPHGFCFKHSDNPRARPQQTRHLILSSTALAATTEENRTDANRSSIDHEKMRSLDSSRPWGLVLSLLLTTPAARLSIKGSCSQARSVSHWPDLEYLVPLGRRHRQSG